MLFLIITTAVILSTKTSENSIPEVSIPAIATDSTTQNNVSTEEQTNVDQQISAEEQANIKVQEKELERVKEEERATVEERKREEERISAEESAKRIERVKEEERKMAKVWEGINEELKRSKKTTNLPISVTGETIKLGGIEIAQFDFSSKMTWNQANSACSALGQGWRLPTRGELNRLYQNKGIIKGFKEDWYWGSTEDKENRAAWQVFSDGLQGYGFKEGKNYVRAVRGAISKIIYIHPNDF